MGEEINIMFILIAFIVSITYGLTLMAIFDYIEENWLEQYWEVPHFGFVFYTWYKVFSFLFYITSCAWISISIHNL